MKKLTPRLSANAFWWNGRRRRAGTARAASSHSKPPIRARSKGGISPYHAYRVMAYGTKA
jgi:hypothetical protein